MTWLKENWGNMMETVVTLASNVGHEAEENTIGTLSKPEAKEALRKHKGNIWAAVTECVEQRQLKVENTNSMKHSQHTYRIFSYSFRGNYSFLNLEIQTSQYIRPKVKVHKCVQILVHSHF